MSRIESIADVVELRTWASNENVTLSSLKEELEAVLSEEESEFAEERAGEVFDELERRSRLLGEAYPFSLVDFSFRTNKCIEDSSYLFCLGLASFKEIPSDLRTIEFESIVKGAAESYFCGKGIRIGAPWKTPEVTEYRQLLESVVELIPDIGPPSRDVAPAGGDGGWDIVVVKNFRDRTYSRVIALGNCATGRTDWSKKGQEKAPNAFWNFFSRNPTDRNVCLTFIAVPFAMSEDERIEKTWANSISFDRFRICEHFPTAGETAMKWLEGCKDDALDLSLI